MDPTTGTFASEDPARDGRGWYKYGGNSPINTTDRDGKEYEWINHVFHGDKQFVDRCIRAYLSGGIESLVNLIERNWHTATVAFASGKSAQVEGMVMLRILVRSLVLSHWAETEVEIGGIRYLSVESDHIRHLINGSIKADLIRTESGGTVL